MSTTGLIQTDANWSLNAPSGNLVLNYNALIRTAPTYTKVFNTGVTSLETIIDPNSIGDSGIYLITVVGDFTSTPWNIRMAFFLPMGYPALAQGAESYLELPTIPSFHAQNGVSYSFTVAYTAVGTNYQYPGLRAAFGNNVSSGSWTIKAYRYTS